MSRNVLSKSLNGVNHWQERWSIEMYIVVVFGIHLVISEVIHGIPII